MPSSPLPSSSASPPRQVIIVGAGVAGLACARELLDASLNITVTVLEARQRSGGRILTHWLDGTDQEALPQPVPPLDSSATLLPDLGPPSAKPPPPAPNSTVDPTAAPPFATTTAPNPSLAPGQPVDPTPELQRNPPTNQLHDPSLNPQPDRALNQASVPASLPIPSIPEAVPASSTGDPSRPHRHDFHQLSKGTISPQRRNQNGTHRLAVDIGASIMHGCGDDNQLILKRAAHDRIRSPIVAGSGFYESTEHAVWYDDNLGRRIPTEKIVDVHNIFFMASRYMAAVASQSDDGAADMQSMFKCGVDYVCKHLADRSLTPVEQKILHKICARSVGYCSPMASMALMQASAGMEVAGTDAHIGIPYEEDDPPFPGEVPSMTPTGIKQQAIRLEKSVMSTQRPPRNTTASRRGGPGDRIVLDGYTPFLIDRLSSGVDVRLSQSVISISKAYRAPVPVTVDEAVTADQSARAGRPRKRGRPAGASNGQSWAEDPEVATRTVLVTTRSGEIFQGDFVVVTVPLGVLKQKDDNSQITFTPPLSEEKQEAINSMGMGVHNKIVLRFREEDIFWPPHIPQLNCIDPRFQFFNLHSYGKTGILLVHVFAESGFAQNYWGLGDEGVVAEVLTVLGGMLCAPLEHEAEADKPLPPTPGPVSARTRESVARSKTARLMGICESCRRPITDRAAPCPHCGFVHGEDDHDHDHDVDLSLEEHQAEKLTALERDPATLDQENGIEELIMPSKQVTWDTLPAPVEYLVTRWDEDPYCLGSYSYMPCGSSWPMIEQLAAPEPRDSEHPYLFFAGEHCSDLGWQCVHGAYETGIRAAKEILECFDDGARASNTVIVPPVKQETAQLAVSQSTKPRAGSHPFWTAERERALTRALIGYSDVYGNMRDVIDEIAYAVFSFKKEPTDVGQEAVRELVTKRIQERAAQNDPEASVFVKFHQVDEESAGEDYFPKPFEEVNKRPRLVGLNGSKLRERYAGDIVRELTSYAKLVAENQISYRETLRKIAVTIYKKDGGLMTKRCLSEYLRTQEFGNGPQKELFLEKYLSLTAKKG